MPESMLEQVWSRAGSLGWTIIVSLAAWSAAGAAETLPASVRACAALTDSLQRLVCYDREVARFPGPAAQAATKPTAAPAPDAVAAAKSAPTPPASAPSGGAPSNTSSTTAATNTGAAAGNAGTATSASTTTAQDSGRISARVVTIDHRPSEMVLHLDNGQVWQQLQSVSGDLSLREGDTVKIEKHFGSYWLSGPHVSSMRVRQIS
jgi:hypothetical protein